MFQRKDDIPLNNYVDEGILQKEEFQKVSFSILIIPLKQKTHNSHPAMKRSHEKKGKSKKKETIDHFSVKKSLSH